MTCCVRSAILTALSLGSAMVSSIEFVCSDCVPPSTAASAWNAVRTMLFSGCLSHSEQPAVWVWKRISHDSLRFGAEAFAHVARPDAARGAQLRDLLEEVEVAVPEERQPRREVVDVEPALHALLDVGEAVGERERQLLRRGRCPPRGCDSPRPRWCSTAARASSDELDQIDDDAQATAAAGSTSTSARCIPSGCRSAACRAASRTARRCFSAFAR